MICDSCGGRGWYPGVLRRTWLRIARNLNPSRDEYDVYRECRRCFGRGYVVLGGEA